MKCQQSQRNRHWDKPERTPALNKAASRRRFSSMTVRHFPGISLQCDTPIALLTFRCDGARNCTWKSDQTHLSVGCVIFVRRFIGAEDKSWFKRLLIHLDIAVFHSNRLSHSQMGPISKWHLGFGFLHLNLAGCKADGGAPICRSNHSFIQPQHPTNE